MDCWNVCKCLLKSHVKQSKSFRFFLRFVMMTKFVPSWLRFWNWILNIHSCGFLRTSHFYFAFHDIEWYEDIFNVILASFRHCKNRFAYFQLHVCRLHVDASRTPAACRKDDWVRWNFSSSWSNCLPLIFAFDYTQFRWMIRLQSTQKMTIKNHSEVKISTISVDSPKVFENIYDVIETLQKICSNMNSYFGKKVTKQTNEIEKVFSFFTLTGLLIFSQVIFTILTAFICITAQLYRLINNIRQGLKQNRAIWNAAASFSLIITHIVELWAIFSSGHRVKETWSSLVERLHESKRKFGPDEKFKVQIDDLVSIMIFTRVEMKAAGLFNIDLSVITSVSFGHCCVWRLHRSNYSFFD